PPLPSGSTMVIAKLFVPAGGLDHANGGETFSPTQFALPGVLLEYFFGIGVPSLKAADVNTKGSAALAICTIHHDAKNNPQTSKRLPLLCL
ncbi:MAG TPA: hypothetical protein VLX11_09785, partial [Candidatus Acidoferrales bacterium]|nr:hypothetical protein [Candidatus Acidoferrales bacterium]